MTLWSCKVKKEDKVGAGPQKMAVNQDWLNVKVFSLLFFVACEGYAHSMDEACASIFW